MAGGGGEVVPGPPRPQAAARGGGRPRKRQTPSLPLDIVLEIAARTDPATLVRCASTCGDMRGRVADPAFRRRLRLRHAADRFVPSLLRGHLEVRYLSDYRSVALHLVDITGAGDTTTARLPTAADGFPPHPDGKTAGRQHQPLASRDGLLLVRTTDWQPPHDELRVCDPATGRSQALPPEPTFPGAAQKNWDPYVLLVGDGGAAVDGVRPFQVLKVNLVMSGHHCYLEIQTFSSEDVAWGSYAEIRTPHLHGSSLLRRVTPLVADGAVYWLCVTKSAAYVLNLHISTAQVTVTTLPVSFPCSDKGIDYLLATATAGGGELMVLVADGKKNNICAWAQTRKPTMMAKWKQRPQVVVESEAMLRFRNARWSATFHVYLHWFAERSGLVLFSCGIDGEFWLDLRSMEIVRWFPGSPDLYRSTECLPYEMDLASWVPTFSSTII
ncbi:unnamed protein product [Urochloa decumbens]|uniref:DUF7595 domain-containing protein n=1 Tax=Urochloa decumbens TaxID=240449 RepID=A0ABC9G091_9POAL